jgi:hypothetical protein
MGLRQALLLRDTLVSARSRDLSMCTDVMISAHMNLNDEYLPYKHLIGQVILDVGSSLLSRWCDLTTIRRRTRN